MSKSIIKHKRDSLAINSFKYSSINLGNTLAHIQAQDQKLTLTVYSNPPVIEDGSCPGQEVY